MQCGAKCFLVEIEVNGEKQIKRVIARTPAAARKTIRTELDDGEKAKILTVKRDHRQAIKACR